MENSIHDIWTRPTIDAKKDLFTAAKRKAEDIRVQIRKHHSSSLKKGKYARHSVEMEEVSNVKEILWCANADDLLQFQKLTDKYVKEVDKILGDLQKSMSLK